MGLGCGLALWEVVGRGNPGVKNLALPADSRPAVAFQFAASPPRATVKDGGRASHSRRVYFP